MKPAERDGQVIREELERVLASAGFARNARMSRFLRFLVERHLEGRNDELKESVIAVEVFGRRPDYDPKLDSIVRTEAGRLRARLNEYYAGDGSSAPGLIDVPKGGYIPVFRQPQAARERWTPGFAYRWLIIGVACSAVALTAAGWWSLRHGNAPIRIAVLPLKHISADSSDDYFADGLTGEIIRDLSVIDGLAVRSQTSSFAFKGQPRNVREMGKQLDAEYLVEGSVLRAADRLRIDAQVIRVRDDSPVWSGRFDRQLTDVFAIQDEIALGIVNNLRLQLGRGRRRYETSLEAYDLYLEARARSFGRSQPATVEDIGGFEKAIAKDPSFAPAYAALGSVYALQSALFPVDHASDELARMRAAAAKAIQLDPLLAEAHAALALTYAREAQWEQAEKRFRHAIELDRNRSRTFIDFGMWVLYVLGRNQEALEQMRMAQTADPLSSEVHLDMAWLLMSFDRYDEAATHCLKVSADDPLKVQCSGRVRLGQGRIDEAVQIFSEDPHLAGNPQARGFLGYAYARSGKRDEAERMAAGSRYPNEQALIYAGLGDKDRTLAALERMSVVGAQRIGRYLNYPEMALLRGDPRLQATRKKVGLPIGPE